jgi:hypothetical protein
MKTRLLLLATVVVVACASFAEGRQTVKVNPSQAVFTASPDHNTAALTSYSMEVSRQDNGTVTRTTDLGKPVPAANSDITVPLVRSGLSNNVVYVFHIIATGPGGSTRSAAPSNPFVLVEAPAGASNLRAQ